MIENNGVNQIEDMLRTDRSYILRRSRSAKKRQYILPPGSQVFEQVLTELKDDLKRQNSTHGINAYNEAYGIPKTPHVVFNQVLTEDSASVEHCRTDGTESEPSMYLSCFRYPWVCARTNCVHRTLKAKVVLERNTQPEDEEQLKE